MNQNRPKRPAAAKTDQLCCLALAGLLVTTALVYEMTDGAALRAAEADRTDTGITAAAPPIDFTPLLEAVEALRADRYDAAVPLDRVCQTALREACGEYGVPVHLALGLMEVESGFDPEADNGLCYGLCQLNRRYYPDFLAPEDNIRCGVAHLGNLLEQYGDTAAALRAYNLGWDDGGREYPQKVMKASEKWRDG